METPKIIFEDEYLIVLDKPSGWITDSANTTRNQPVIQEWVAENCQFLINNFQYRNGIVHRLDKETSGILLIAKTVESLEELQRQFKERLIEKTYIALVHGKVEQSEGVINETVGRLPWRRDRFGVMNGGKEAVTNYRKIIDYRIENKDHSLLELKPKTGRTHQIRIHLKHLGHPIVADEFYTGRKTARNDRRWCPRLFLHAGRIKLSHPITKEVIEFESPLPVSLAAILK